MNLADFIYILGLHVVLCMLVEHLYQLYNLYYNCLLVMFRPKQSEYSNILIYTYVLVLYLILKLNIEKGLNF